jgi:hypothetical protein
MIDGRPFRRPMAVVPAPVIQLRLQRLRSTYRHGGRPLPNAPRQIANRVGNPLLVSRVPYKSPNSILTGEDVHRSL